MARGPRWFPPDSVLHVVNRGNERRTLFHCVDDYADFLHLAERALRTVPLRIIAYALMPNHFHLVAWPTRTSQLSQFLHLLTTAHAHRLRLLTGTTGLGHVYQNRFKAFVIDQDERYVNTVKYVEANALRAGLVARAEDWPWSSLRERRGRARLIVGGPVPLPPADEWTSLVNQGSTGTGTL